MATTLASDLKIYQQQVEGGRAEVLAQHSDAFNAGSNGAITLRNEFTKGQYGYESFFPSVASLYTRQDLTSVAAGTATKSTEDEQISVKMNRRYQHEYALASMRLRGNGAVEPAMFAFGQQLAKAAMVDRLNVSLAGAVAALGAEAGVLNDVTGGSDGITYSDLLDTMAKFGDAADNVAAWVMHSKQYFDLAKGTITDNAAYTNIADGVIRTVDVPGLGRPIIITDSTSLIDASASPDAYFVLGLTQGAIEITDGGSDDMVDQVSGLEQIVLRLQGEDAYNMKMKGFKWDVANGAANPTTATVSTASNWDKIASDDKDLAGVILKCEGADQAG